MSCQHGRIKLSGPDQTYIWACSGGACAICGDNLLHDVRTNKRLKWGELAHIVGAKSSAARGNAQLSQLLETDPANIVLLCPSCHTKADKDEAAYTVERLRRAKAWHEERVRLAAGRPASAQALPIAMTSVIAGGPNVVNDSLIADALLQVGLVRGRNDTLRIDLPNPATYGGRVAAYWEQHAQNLRYSLFAQLEARSASQGPLDTIAFFGRADMPSLMTAGTILGNRCALNIFQPRRADGTWTWVDLEAPAPDFRWNDPRKLDGDGPLALVLSLSVPIPHDDVVAAFPPEQRPRIVEFTVEKPDFELVKGPKVASAFHDKIRRCVADLEAHLGPSRELHVFPAMPASLATHFGCAVTLNFMPTFHIYDRGENKAFVRTMTLPLPNS